MAEPLEDETLFNALDADNVSPGKYSPLNGLSEAAKPLSGFSEMLKTGAKHKEFSSKFPESKHSDASDRTINFGPSIQKDRKNFGVFSPQTIDKLQADNCVHDICYPPGWDVDKARRELSTPLPAREPAKTYKFALDSFQKRAINCIERSHNVLVAAHTSAGKTTVAEYAIAKSIKESTRVIYTSPIKALSNQKYRDLYEEFQDVGLMTGDVTINASASCLVMTTEILRNMLYRGSEVIREVSWVIFDEIHYMRDKTRGVIYEECLILLPEITKFIFLSATIPNAAEFACWVAKLNKAPCNVVYTEKRPVPLQHYVTPRGGEGLMLVMDEKKDFKMENFTKAVSSIKLEDFRTNTVAKKRKKRTGEEDLFRVVKLIMAKRNYPAIIFAFSRRECETNALLMSKLDFNSDHEKTTIEQIFNNAIDSLSTDDKKLPQVSSILPILKRGIGIHHSGLLPILKEVIEILFQEGLLKCLFATETFAMGINMPAKTVVFTNLRKFDGTDNRYLSSGEYIQMSGRAGRRGIDDKGLIILMLSQKIDPGVIKKMLQGSADKLDSSFSLGYNMLLNLLRVEGSDPEYMISHSFHQFQANNKTPVLRKKLGSLREKSTGISVEDEESVKKLFSLRAEFLEANEKVKETKNLPHNILPFLNPGRVVQVVNKGTEWGWGVIINFEKVLTAEFPKTGILSKKKQIQRFTYVVNVFLRYRIDPATDLPEPLPRTAAVAEGEGGSPSASSGVLPCALETLDQLSTIRVYMPRDISQLSSRQKLQASLSKVFENYSTRSLPLLDPIENMSIGGKGLRKNCRKLASARKNYTDSPLSRDEAVRGQLPRFAEKHALEAEAEEVEKTLEDIEKNRKIRTRLSGMRRVLKKLGHITEENVVNIKGRVACDVSTSDELLATELLLTGCFNDLSVEQIVALASCLVSCDRTNDVVRLKAELAEPYFRLKKAARHVAAAIQAEGVEIDPDEFVASFKPALMEVAHAWCKGAKFAQICKMTAAFEGSVIRVIRRLGELLGEFVTACKVIGNEDLRAKFEQGAKLIKRDIVFAASLYL